MSFPPVEYCSSIPSVLNHSRTFQQSQSETDDEEEFEQMTSTRLTRSLLEYTHERVLNLSEREATLLD